MNLDRWICLLEVERFVINVLIPHIYGRCSKLDAILLFPVQVYLA
jgi:hypothetical protein